MSAPYICSACCRRQLRSIHGLRLQWHAKASFTSSRNIGASSNPATKDNLSDIADFHEDGPIKIPRSVPAPPQRPKNSGDVLEAIFESAMQDDSKPPTQSTNLPEDDLGPSVDVPNIDVYRHAEIAREMLRDNRVPKAEVWKYFVEHIAQTATYDQPSARPTFPILTGVLFDDIRRAIKNAWKDAKGHQSLPSMTEVMRVYLEQGLIRHEDWTQVIRDMLLGFFDQQGRPRNRKLIKFLETDLLGVWNLFCLRYQTTHVQTIPAQVNSMDWSFLPQILPSQKNIFLQEPGKVRSLQILSGVMFPNLPSQGPYRYSVGCAAILTYALLSHSSRDGSDVEIAGNPFLHAIGMVVGPDWSAHHHIKDTITQYLALKTPEKSEAVWKKLLESTRNSSKAKTRAQAEGSGEISQLVDENERLNELIYRAVKARELQWLDNIYASAVEGHSQENQQRDEASSLELHNKFIGAYMSIRHPARAIEVWNHAIQTGLTPTLHSWTAMIDGCRIAKDVNAMESVWKRFLDTGLQPDVVLWTTVICGFIENHGTAGRKKLLINAEKGIGLLQEMGRTWLEAEKQAMASKSKNTAAKPTVYTLNAVLVSLIRRQFLDIMPRLLPWGRQFGIEPDIVTYNTYLRSYVRAGNTDKVHELLREMQDSGIQADEATYTILIEETLRDSTDFTPEQRAAAVNRIFDEMNNSGLQPNHLHYAKLVYILLGDASHTGDTTTVQSVLHRMSAEGLNSNNYILTCLLEYHFAQTPPDWDSINVTINEVRKLKLANEIIFYDRVISCYAAAGETTAALTYFRKCDRAGARVGWSALCTLFHALMANGEIESAKQFVRDVRSSRRDAPSKMARGMLDEHAFWDTVAEFEAGELVA